MPIYEYRCGACAHRLDALQKLSDPLLTDCPECGAVALKKLVSAPVFRLKGGGWYETDFKSDKEKRRNLADGSGSDAAAKGESAGKDGAADKSGSEKGAGGAKAEKSPGSDSGSGQGKQSGQGKESGQGKQSGQGKESTGKASGSKGAGTAAA